MGSIFLMTASKIKRATIAATIRTSVPSTDISGMFIEKIVHPSLRKNRM